jgi:SH3-like domain-containing protein
MDPAVASIIVATIATIGSVISILINKTKNEIISSKKETVEMRKENKEDHAIVASLLNKVIHDVHNVDEKLDEHIESHKNS